MPRLPQVIEVVPESPAALAGITAGDELIAVNGVVPTDVIEYQQLIDDEDPELTVRRGDDDMIVQLDKVVGVPAGLRLSASIFDRVQTCDNHCEFCFIYQLPPGMRRSLYLKDDDYRLSFLYGNFTTLTRFTELDLARVVEERLGPIYVSIHSTDPGLRARMLRNPRGATSLRWLRALCDHRVTVHGQIVLCPGINDGAALERTAAEILMRYPELASVGIVPLGLSRYNPEPHLVGHTTVRAAENLEIVHFWQERALDLIGRRMFFASDELYLLAGLDVPSSHEYEGFPQHENGIGMVRAFYDEIERMEAGAAGAAPVQTGAWRAVAAAPAEWYRSVRHTSADPEPESGPVVVVTGQYGADTLRPVADRLGALAGRPIRVLPVSNRFFGGNTAVAGLLVGEDLRVALAEDREPAGRYLVPDVALSGDRFLDEASLEDVAASASAPLMAVPSTASALVEAAAR